MLETDMDVQVLHRVATAYYLDDLRQADIAEMLGVSRPSVSKLLAEVRRIGMIRFEVEDPSTVDRGELATRVETELGLDRVLIAPGDQVQRGFRGLGDIVADELIRLDLQEGDVVLVSSGKTAYEVSGNPLLPQLPGVLVAPTVGGQQEPVPWHQTNETVRRFAQRTGAVPRYIFAPALPSQQLWDSLQADPSFQEITDLWGRARVAVLGIGAPPVQRDDLPSVVPRDAPSLRAATGDIALQFFDHAGAPVEFPGSERLIRTSREQLQAVPHAIAVTAGREKVVSIASAAAVGLFRTLITDVRTAEELLAAPSSPDVRRA